jgi:hypothetical protein
MTKKSNLTLTDTVVIIDAHENHYWESLCNSYQIAVPASIIENEAFHFESNNKKIAMNPTSWINQGKIIRIEASLEDFKILQKKTFFRFNGLLGSWRIRSISHSHVNNA